MADIEKYYKLPRGREDTLWPDYKSLQFCLQEFYPSKDFTLMATGEEMSSDLHMCVMACVPTGNAHANTVHAAPHMHTHSAYIISYYVIEI